MLNDLILMTLACPLKINQQRARYDWNDIGERDHPPPASNMNDKKVKAYDVETDISQANLRNTDTPMKQPRTK